MLTTFISFLAVWCLAAGFPSGLWGYVTQGSVVLYEGSDYIAKESYWTPLPLEETTTPATLPHLWEHRGLARYPPSQSWLRAYPYKKSDEVTYNGVNYFALKDNQGGTEGNNPSVATDAWKRISACTIQCEQAWNVHTLYSIGDRVTYKDVVYQATDYAWAESESQSPAVDTLSWKIVCKCYGEVCAEKMVCNPQHFYWPGSVVSDYVRNYVSLTTNAMCKLGPAAYPDHWAPSPLCESTVKSSVALSVNAATMGLDATASKSPAGVITAAPGKASTGVKAGSLRGSTMHPPEAVWLRFYPYKKGAKVTYDGVIYEAVANNTATTNEGNPSVATAAWKRVEECVVACEAPWETSKVYTAGQRVSYNKFVYIAKYDVWEDKSTAHPAKDMNSWRKECRCATA